ncbi:silent information regulator family protein [Colletotrichum truncatum]|uniref:Silent information regulator family protein n=1 Tax=Colletotrichum truncatum TaxID=5467 RepID=A0ACC3Z355_COLTU|nr:silent information regulator family protein [Colletotrichum truncatum]KAF6793169.1 silent information regulator family protein [Colletotrichum truncatum]
MADTAPKVAEAERRESPSLVDKKAALLAEKIKTSNHFIAFTGAGISTSAGIPDFRGPDGVWTLRAQGRKRTGKATSTLQAIPTPTHMALVELQNRGLLKYLVSQNCDGLHRKSGISSDRISELHGNSNREYCKDCGKEYIRDFRAVATYEVSVYDHRTGRKCVKCGGVLFDSIVNFGESLPEEPFKRAHDNAKKADLCLALGSSLTVTPANEITEIVGKKKRGRGVGGQLVICNLQSTPLDDLSELRVWSTTDDLMIRVMEKLGIPIPRFVLRRRLVLQLETTESGKHQLTVQGVDEDGTPATFLQSVKLAYNRRVVRSEPFAFNFRGELDTGTELKLELEFMGHYGEPNLEIVHVVNEKTSRILHLLEYDPMTGEWKTTTEEGADDDTGLERDISIIDLTSD